MRSPESEPVAPSAAAAGEPSDEPPEPPEPGGPPEPPEPAEPPEPPDFEGRLRITEEGIFGPGLMITQDGIVALGISIRREGLRILAKIGDSDAPEVVHTRERLKQLGRELRTLLALKGDKGLEGMVEIHEGHVRVGAIEIPIGDRAIDVPALVLKILAHEDRGDDPDRDTTNSSCPGGECDLRCAPSKACKASCAGGGCRQTARPAPTRRPAASRAPAAIACSAARASRPAA